MREVSGDTFSEHIHQLHTDLLETESELSRRQALQRLRDTALATMAGSMYEGSALLAAENPDAILNFDGKEDFVNIHQLFYFGNQPITVDVVVSPKSASGQQTIVGNQHNGGVALQLNNGKAEFLVHNGKQYLRAVSDEEIPLDAPVHLTGICDGATVRLYVNQQLQKRFSVWNGRHKSSKQSFIVGADPDDGGQPQHFFSGTLEKLRISGVARDRTRGWKHAPFGKTDPFDAVYFDMSAIHEAQVPDRSKWKHHGSLNGDLVQQEAQ